jgi:hypothetical protein
LPPAASRQRVAVALFDGFGGHAARQTQVFTRDGQIGAGGEPHEVQRVSAGPDFVQVVDAPDEPAFRIPPGSKVFDMQVADSEHLWRFCEAGTDLRPMLQPAVEGSAEEGKSGLRHALVL